MAMLAEPRQRKRYNLMPKGKALYEDESRFGTKMLEKMGWKKGEGLGASSEGSKDFVRIRYKNDAYGLGFEQRDDQWTQHEESFNGLLKTLHNEENDGSRYKENTVTDNCDDELPPRIGFGFEVASAKGESKSEGKKMKEKISGISLEERSKQSKARVHYKKFTKGKDLAQYSEKDLANIFGKKEVEEQPENDFYKNLSNTFGVFTEEANSEQINNSLNVLEGAASKKKDKKKKKKDNQEEKPNIQQQTFTSNLSVQDYFKMKMEAIKNKQVVSNSVKELDNINNNLCFEQPKKTLKKKKKEDKKAYDCLLESDDNKSKDRENDFVNKIKNETKNEETGEIISAKSEVNILENEKISKKIKKTELENLFDNEAEGRDKDCDQELAEKKSKKNKNTTDQTNLAGEEIEVEPQIVKKLKKSKVADIEESIESKVDETKSETRDLVNDFKQESAEKKSKKNKKALAKAKSSENQLEVIENAMKLKESETEQAAETNLNEIKPKKRKNKSKNKIDNDEVHENNTAKKRKLEEPAAREADLKDPETHLQEKSCGKKKTKNNKELNDVIEIIDSEKDEPVNPEIQPIMEKKPKTKKTKEPAIESSTPTAPLAVSNSNNSNESSNDKNLNKEVSCNAKHITESQVNDLEELKNNLQATNIYPISTFCAEKFRNISLKNFKGSSLAQIEGYGLNSDLQLDIYNNKYDEDRILNLWKNALNKYEQTDKPKKTYQQYIRDSVVALKAKRKPAKLYVKTWQRKNAFQL